MSSCFFFLLYDDHPELHVLTHSFPTRRSADLRAIRSNSQKLCVLVAAAILRKPRLTPSASNTFIRPIRSLQGAPVRRCVNASENPVRSSTSSNRSVILAGGSC